MKFESKFGKKDGLINPFVYFEKLCQNLEKRKTNPSPYFWKIASKSIKRMN